MTRGGYLPVVAITGTRGKSTTAWLLYSMLLARHLPAALWCSTGVFVNGQKLEGELAPWLAVVRAIQEGELACAIQELEPTVVASVGLPRAMYPVGAVTTICGNDEGCWLAPLTSTARRAVEQLCEAVHPHGALVVNADDPMVLNLAAETEGQVVFFALHPDNPAIRRANREGLPAVWQEEGRIVANPVLVHLSHSAPFNLAPLVRSQRTHLAASEGETALEHPAEKGDRATVEGGGKREIESRTADRLGSLATVGERDERTSPLLVGSVREAPCTLNGTLTFQIHNILCATGLALILGLPLATIRAVIGTFLPSPTALPGSCNLFRVAEREIVVEQARDPWTVRSLVRGLRQWQPRRSLVVTDGFGWLSLDQLRELGRILGRLNGLVIVSEELAPERLTAFQAGLFANPTPPVLLVQADRRQALHWALNATGKGELCLILTDTPEEAIAVVEGWQPLRD